MTCACQRDVINLSVLGWLLIDLSEYTSCMCEVIIISLLSNELYAFYVWYLL